MKLALDHWHIEPSSICTLRCPRCPRAEVPETLLNQQLTLAFFKNQIGEDTVKQIKKITFCGNDGDPIYCKELIDICAWIKSINPLVQLIIITNGSYKPDNWWHGLGKVLNHNDELHWSIDGWDHDSNVQYRVNSNWHSIMSGISAFQSSNNSTYRVWAAIAFKFNQDHIDVQRTLANQLNFDCYQLTLSTKFHSKYPEIYSANDHLEPDNKQFVAAGHRFQRDNTVLSTKVRPGAELVNIFLQRAQALSRQNTHSGICMIGNKGVFLNSRGEFYPCCWTANRYEHNSNWHTLAESKFNLNNKTFNEILQDPFWSTDFLRFDSFECRTKCTSARLSDVEHTTEW
jgi:MoaA/NifB/PqqE/SkfB family radical SAM enzyme